MLDFDSLTENIMDAAVRGLEQAGMVVERRAQARAPIRNIFGHAYRFRPKTADELREDFRSLPSGTLRNMLDTGTGKFTSRWVGPKRVPTRWSDREWEAAQAHLASYERGDDSPLTRQGAYEVRSGRARFHSVQEGGEVTVGGRLRSEIYTSKVRRSGAEASVMVISPTSYAKYMEFGTRHNRAHPYLRPALEESRDEIRERIASAVAEAAKGGMGNVELEIHVTL